MNSDARIDAYIAKARPFARPILERVRERVHAVLPNVDEAIKWSRPAYLQSGKLVLMTAAFKEHLRISFWRGRELRADQSNSDAMSDLGDMHSIDQLPPDAELDRLIREAAELAKSAPAPRKTKHEPKPAPELHPDFAAALAKAPQAQAVLDGFPRSAQRDYFEWIVEAKQDGTRQKRIATAIEWLSEGKRRHWKYEKC